MNEVLDYDHSLTGLRREGVYTYLRDFIPKFAEIPSMALPFIIMAILGYKSDPDIPCDGSPPKQNDSVILFLKLCFSVIPGGISLICSIYLLRFPIRDAAQHDRVMETSILHSANHAVKDPLYNHELEPPPMFIDAPDASIDDLRLWLQAKRRLVEVTFKKKGTEEKFEENRENMPEHIKRKASASWGAGRRTSSRERGASVTLSAGAADEDALGILDDDLSEGNQEGIRSPLQGG